MNEQNNKQSTGFERGIEDGKSRLNFATIGLIFCLLTSWPLAVFVYKKYNGESYSKKFDLQISDYDKEIKKQKSKLDPENTRNDSSQSEADDKTSQSNSCIFTYINGDINVSREGDICITIKCNKTKCSFTDHGLKKESEIESETETDLSASIDPSILDIKPEYMFWFWASVASAACTFSVLGLFSSVLFRKRNAEIFLQSKTDIAVLFFLSIVSGLLLLALVVGGYLGGSLFPNVSGGIENFGFNSWVSLKFRGPDWGKLAVWAYISGFYERIIPSMIDKIVRDSEKK